MSTVALIGLGVMGSRMAPHLSQVSELRVFDTSPEALAAVSGRGIHRMDSVREAAPADVVILMLPSSDVVDAVVGRVADESSLAHALSPGTLVIDMGSSVPARTAELAARLACAGVAVIDAPVSGGPRKADTGELTIMVGGLDRDVERARPLLEAVGSSVTHTGRVGSAHALKSLNNLLSVIGLVGALEVLTVGTKFGLEPQLMLDVINRSTGRNQSTEVKLRSAVLEARYDVGFSLGLSVKDISTALSLAEQQAVNAPLSQAAVSVCRAALDFLGDGAADQSEIARFLEVNTGVTLRGAEVPEQGRSTGGHSQILPTASHEHDTQAQE